LDYYIITQIDSRFDKSFARTMFNFIQLGDLERAAQVGLDLKNMFPIETVAKYESYYELLDKAKKEDFDKKEKEKEDSLIRLTKRNKEAPSVNSSNKSSPETREKVNDSKNLKTKENLPDTANTSKTSESTLITKPPKKNWYKWIFGPVLFVGAAAGLFFLFRNKNKFIK